MRKYSIFSSVLSGNTLPRAYQNEEILKQCGGIKGRILDLGAGKSEYKEIFDKNAEVITTDIDPSSGADVIFDANEKFPIQTGAFDFVFCTNVLEHLKNPEGCVNEIYRVLKPGGTLFLSVPFLYWFHASPNDYFRFTHEGIGHLLRSAGFRKIEIKRLGGRFSLFLELFALEHLPFISPFVRLFYPLARFLDEHILSRTEMLNGKHYYMIIFIRAEK